MSLNQLAHDVFSLYGRTSWASWSETQIILTWGPFFNQKIKMLKSSGQIKVSKNSKACSQILNLHIFTIVSLLEPYIDSLAISHLNFLQLNFQLKLAVKVENWMFHCLIFYAFLRILNVESIYVQFLDRDNITISDWWLVVKLQMLNTEWYKYFFLLNQKVSIWNMNLIKW